MIPSDGRLKIQRRAKYHQGEDGVMKGGAGEIEAGVRHVIMRPSCFEELWIRCRHGEIVVTSSRPFGLSLLLSGPDLRLWVVHE